MLIGMCGRYATARQPDDLVEEFGVDRVAVDEAALPEFPLPANYNVAPTDNVYAVLERMDKAQPAAAPQRQLRVVRWGLVPSWAKDPKVGARMINARAETLAEKPAFRKAFAARRCLLPADGYYEWYVDDATRKKQPYFICGRSGGILPMAGLFEFWRDPDARADTDPWLWSCTVITTEATDDLGRLHDRMPMLVEPANWDRWLDPRLDDPAQLQRLLVPAAPGRLEAYPVSTQVNDVRHNGPELIAALDDEMIRARRSG
jgi:putative SOS response-associated peptidase YedK